MATEQGLAQPPLVSLGRQRSNSAGNIGDSSRDKGFVDQFRLHARDADGFEQSLRANSTEPIHAATSIGFHPTSRSREVPLTPRAARLETLEWEASGGGQAQQRGENECVRVAARFRPLSQNELSSGAVDNLCVRFTGDGQSCTLSLDAGAGRRDYNFAYDYMFQPEASQEDVYGAVARPIIDGVINGYNGAILAYGQTGSGKTHTMLGPAGAQAFVEDRDIDAEALGIIPRALQDLLDYAAATEGQVQLRASYVEIYNEHIIDLLAPVRGGSIVRDQIPASATVREQAQSLYLPTVTETPIGSVNEALEVMRTGNRSRHQAQTQMNRHSSRSHAVFIVTVTNRIDPSRHKFAQLYLVDLAGSERVKKTGVEGKQLEEAQNINKSLLSLGQVIWALAHKQKHIPYRDSKLTQLLRNTLGGNARTAIMVAASPHMDNAHESLSALRFGQRASLVQNAAHENIAESPAELKRLLQKAREDLNDLRGHCRRLQAEVAAFRAAELIPADEPVLGRSLSGTNVGPLQTLTSKRLLVWGLLPSLVCPLNRAIMRDPVVGADGWTYERVAIERHFARAGRGMPTSPVTGQRMVTRHLVPNMVVKQLISQHMPDLAPPEVRLPVIQLVQCWHVQMILSYLDGRSLARCEGAWSSFLAAAEASQSWIKLLRLEFGAEIPPGNSTDDGNTVAATARARYAAVKKSKIEKKQEGNKAAIGGGPATQGLQLFKPPQ